MEQRTHKLIVFAGQEGAQFQARDFKKLSQVIVNEYLTQGNPNYRNYLIQMLTKAVRNIPLKAHIYAGLTVSISRTYPELAIKILENIIANVQTDLCAGNFVQVLNSLNYLSEAMNVSFLNSLNYMNLLQDLLQAAEKEPEIATKRALIGALVRALPLCGFSLFEKTSHEFKKFMDKLSKMSEGDQLFTYLYQQYNRKELIDYSGMSRLGQDFSQVMQHNGKLRLILDLKNAKINENISSAELYKWDFNNISEEYEMYSKGEGVIVRMWLDQLITTFQSSSNTLLTKFYNLIKAYVVQKHQIRFIVQSLVLRSLRVKNSMTEYFLLLAFKNSQGFEVHSKIVEEVLFQFFNLAQTFELSMLVSFSKVFVYIANNSKRQFDWSKLLQNEQMFLKRSVLLKLLLEKISLLNDKFQCPEVLAPFENEKPFNSEEEYVTAEDKQTFEAFEAEFKKKSNAEIIGSLINTQKDYEIFLEALFRRTCLSHTHLTILSERYSQILNKYKNWDWDLINKIRNFFRNSFFHRLLYFRFMIAQKYLSFSSYINYVGGLKDKSELQMLWVKVELNELNSEFGKLLKNK